MGRWALHFFPFRYLGRKKKAAYSSVVMVQATNLASEKDVKIHIQRSANGNSGNLIARTVFRRVHAFIQEVGRTVGPAVCFSLIAKNS